MMVSLFYISDIFSRLTDSRRLQCAADRRFDRCLSFLLLMLVHLLDVHQRMCGHFYVRRFPAAVLFKEMICTVYGHRQDRYLCLFSKLESAGLELAHLVSLGACALREDA